MYAYLEGKLTYKTPTEVHLDIHGVGYQLLISLNTFSDIEEKDIAKLFTMLYVREDVMSLFGFSKETEKEMFIHLLSVSGIGPNTARVVLSSMTTSEISLAILNENVAAFNKVKGIGPKTAKRLILDLKDKVAKMGLDSTQSAPVLKGDNAKDEALSALVSLGFNKQKVLKKVNDIISDATSPMQVEDIIKEVLKQMS